MYNSENSSVKGKTWISAPDYDSNNVRHSGQLEGLWVGDDEEIEWFWEHSPEGSYVNGFRLRKKRMT